MKNIKKLLATVLTLVLLMGVFPTNAQAATVRLNKTSATVYVGNSLTLRVEGTKAKVSWSSSNRAVATVNSKGKVVGKKAGTTNVSAKVGKKSYKCRVTVKNPGLNATKKTLEVGKSYTLKAVGTSAKSWKSSNPRIATVNSKGKVTAKKAGAVTISCTAANKKTYKCKITVKAPAKPPVEPPAEKPDEEPAETHTLTEREVYEKIVALREEYPEGKHWTNADYYLSKCGYYAGYGCHAFGLLASDAAFGDLPFEKHSDFDKIKVGDLIRVNHDTHTVVALEVKEDSVVVAEGNYNSSIHWGREIRKSDIWETGVYVLTRYPKKAM